MLNCAIFTKLSKMSVLNVQLCKGLDTQYVVFGSWPEELPVKIFLSAADAAERMVYHETVSHKRRDKQTAGVTGNQSCIEACNAVGTGHS